MEFGLFSNGFRPHTTAAQTYEEDLAEIVLADQLGFRDCYISEHHGEPVYIDKVDTLPVPELLMCKAAAVTKRIRIGSAVKLIHLHHPVDTATQAAVADHVIGGGRFIFGFGSGFPSPLFSDERGLSYADRHERLRKSPRSHSQMLGREGAFRLGRQTLARQGHCRHATAASCAAYADGDGNRHAGDDRSLRDAQLHHAQSPARAGRIDPENRRSLHARRQGCGQPAPLSKFAVARYVYLADCRRQAMDDMRADINYELTYQIRRGLIRILTSNYGLSLKADEVTFDQLAEAGVYHLGDPDTVANELRRFFEASAAWHATDRHRKDLGDPRKGVSLDAAVHGAGGAQASRPGAGARAGYRRGVKRREERMRLGMFMMPVHPPARSFTETLAEDEQKALYADQLGFDELWLGEHFSASSEPIPSPLMFMASLVPRTKNLTFGTGVICLPNHDPVTVAAEVAQFDHMSRGHFIWHRSGWPVVRFRIVRQCRPRRARAQDDGIHRDDPTHLGAGSALRSSR